MPNWLSPNVMSFTIGQVILNLSLAFGLAYLAATVYRKLYSGPGYSFSFFVTLLITPVVVAMIMMAIGSNIALSLGLVGALSIVRFRTVIKDTRDMSFLFLMIGVGLCCGSGAYHAAIIGTLFISIMLIGIHWIAKARLMSDEFILVYRKTGETNGEAEAALDSLVSWRKLHGAADLGEEDGCEFTYRIRLSPSTTPESLISRLKSIKGVHDSSLIAPESQLAL